MGLSLLTMSAAVYSPILNLVEFEFEADARIVKEYLCVGWREFEQSVRHVYICLDVVASGYRPNLKRALEWLGILSN